jgi:transglutaminase-like putative cysteine protease
VYAGETKIGRLVLSLDREDGAYVLTTDFDVALRTSGRVQHLFFHEEKNFSLQKPYRLRSIVHGSNVTGKREAWRGEVRDGQFVITVAGKRSVTALPRLTLEEALAPTLFVRRGPAVGQAVAGGSISVLARTTEEIDGSEVEIFLVREGAEENRYLANGELLSGEFAGLRIVRESAGPVPTISLRTRVATASRRAPASGVVRALYMVPEAVTPVGDRERVAGRISGRRLLEVTAAAWPETTEPGPAPQISSAPSVRDLAARLGAGRAPRERLAAFSHWIMRTIVPTDVDGTPSAAQIIARRAGDCTERAELFAALCRASGISSRRVNGLRWHGDAFYAHAWCEVFLGSWVEIDPETGCPVDARFLLLWRKPDARRLLHLLDAQIEVVSFSR